MHEYSSIHQKSAGFHFTSHINTQPRYPAERESARGLTSAKCSGNRGKPPKKKREIETERVKKKKNCILAARRKERLPEQICTQDILGTVMVINGRRFPIVQQTSVCHSPKMRTACWIVGVTTQGGTNFKKSDLSVISRNFQSYWNQGSVYIFVSVDVCSFSSCLLPSICQS